MIHFSLSRKKKPKLMTTVIYAVLYLYYKYFWFLNYIIDQFIIWYDSCYILWRVFFSRIQTGRSITAAPDEIFAQTLFKGIDKGWNCGLVGVSITSDNRKCPKNLKLTEKQWVQPDDVTFLFSQIYRIQTKNVGIIPEMMRLIWCWSQISMNATKKWKNWHFLSQPMIFNVKV